LRRLLALGSVTLGVCLLFQSAVSAGPTTGPAVQPVPPPAASTALEREAEALVLRWAPSFVQEVDSEHPERDRPLPIDFDGDWNASNNWRNLSADYATTKPAAYGSAILTRTHAYLTYTLFYPRDWAWPACFSYVCHDNDLEVLQLVVERGAHAGDGELVLVETKAHRRYVSRAASELKRTASGAPWIEVESGGHGMEPMALAREPAEGTTIFAPRDTDRAETYELLPLHATLWSRRAALASERTLWTAGESGFLAYSGERLGRVGFLLGASMAGQEYAGGVRPPWALKAPHGARGDWFFDPALVAMARHGSFMKRHAEPSLEYVFNPYLADLAAECAGAACPPAPPPAADFGPLQAAGGALLLLGLVSSFRPRSRSA